MYIVFLITDEGQVGRDMTISTERTNDSM